MQFENLPLQPLYSGMQCSVAAEMSGRSPVDL
jgi:hypothetical protein